LALKSGEWFFRFVIWDHFFRHAIHLNNWSENPRPPLADAKIKFDEVVTQTELERAQEYSDVLKELATLKQNMKSSTDQLNRTVLMSPMRGVVNNLSVTTIGGVVRPGEEILQIIPLDEELFVEARVKPENIANIRRGQEATIKLSAYDYTIYGTLKARVGFISADTFKDERSRAADGDPHYKVTLKVDMTSLTDRQAGIEIRPGMQASVELHTGQKTVLQYLLKPLYKSKDALRER
jgi:adhesin transport system membrane fusion protein